MNLGDLLKDTIQFGEFGDKQSFKEYTEIVADGVYTSFDNEQYSIRKKQHTIPKGVINGTTKNTLTEYFEVRKKLPFSFFLKILQFYYDVNKHWKFEASVIVYVNPLNVEVPQDILDEAGDALLVEDGVYLYVPHQTNSQGRSDFNKGGDRVYHWLESNLVGMVETHSHNTMAAFWSGTDDHYERHSKLRMFLVYGHLGKNQDLMYRLRYCYNREYTDYLSLDTLVDIPKIEIKTQTQVNITGSQTHLFSHLKDKESEENVKVYTAEDILLELDLESGVIDYPEEAWFGQIQNVLVKERHTNHIDNHYSHVDYMDDDEQDIDDTKPQFSEITLDLGDDSLAAKNNDSDKYSQGGRLKSLNTKKSPEITTHKGLDSLRELKERIEKSEKNHKINSMNGSLKTNYPDGGPKHMNDEDIDEGLLETFNIEGVLIIDDLTMSDLKEVLIISENIDEDNIGKSELVWGGVSKVRRRYNNLLIEYQVKDKNNQLYYDAYINGLKDEMSSRLDGYRYSDISNYPSDSELINTLI